MPVRHAGSVAFLLSALGARAALLFAERLAPLGVSPRAYGVLSQIAAARGSSQQQLADALGVHRNNMVSLVDDLEAAGLARRRRSGRDRRAFELELTPAGATVVEKVEALLPALDAEVTAGLSDRQRTDLAVRLVQLADSLGLSPGVHPGYATPTQTARHQPVGGDVSPSARPESSGRRRE